MKVYLVKCVMPYEGEDAEEIWDNEEAAEKRAGELQEEHRCLSYEVEEFEVQSNG